MKVFAADDGADKVTAFLDGQPVTDAVMADDELGVVEVYQRDKTGASVIKAPTIILHGEVEIKPGSLADHGVTVPWKTVEVE